jgi:Tol biopolymer transport system component
MTRVLIHAILAVMAVEPATITFHYPRWSPDGRWLVFTANLDGDDEVWIASRDGSEKQKLTDNDVADTDADWHPDGRRIIFRRGAGTFVMNRDGSNVRAFNPDEARGVRPIEVEERRTGNGQAVFVSREGRPGWRISPAAWAEQPSVSPNSVHIVFEQRANPNDILASEIVVWEVTNESLRTIARGTDPSWSADGRSILFKTPNANGELFIAIADLYTGGTRVIAPGVHPHFSPDGKWIAYMSNGSARADVHVVGADGRDQRCVTCEWK